MQQRSTGAVQVSALAAGFPNTAKWSLQLYCDCKQPLGPGGEGQSSSAHRSWSVWLSGSGGEEGIRTKHRLGASRQLRLNLFPHCKIPEGTGKFSTKAGKKTDDRACWSFSSVSPWQIRNSYSFDGWILSGHLLHLPSGAPALCLLLPVTDVLTSKPLCPF